MATYIAKVRYADIREIGIEADSLEQAIAKYEAGDFDYEHSIDFYSEEELSPLKKQED